MHARLALALAAARIAAEGSRRLRRGGGTVVPGHVAGFFCPDALRQLAAGLPRGSVLISGTNGKTTTGRIAAAVAEASGLRVLQNRAGANLPAGILSALASSATLGGAPRGDVGIFEVDEAHVPTAVDALRPRVLALTNLFRDQLDRYGEIDLLGRIWDSAVAALSADATLVLNVDDPLLAHLADRAPGKALTFGIEARSIGVARLAHEADRQLCPCCGHRLRYTWCYYGHLGHYGCDGCGWERPNPDLAVTEIVLEEASSTLTLSSTSTKPDHLELPLPGLYNVYNAAAGAAIAQALDLAPDCLPRGLRGLKPAFGRQERVPVGNGSLTLSLVKNPVAFNQTLRTLPSACELAVIAINDRLADGTDVSWLWDVDCELLAERPTPALCTGTRAYDMALRAKYAGAPNVEVEPLLDRAVERAVAAASEGGCVVIFSTYTATLEVHEALHRRGYVSPFWET